MSQFLLLAVSQGGEREWNEGLCIRELAVSKGRIIP